MADLQTSDLEFWYAVHCKPFKEWLAATALADYLGLMVYLPEIKRRFRGQIHYAPLFPRYLFVRVNLRTVTLNRINAMFGVARLVTFGNTPQPVPASVIEVLRQCVDRINTQGGLPDHAFRPGDAVRLKSGPLHGLKAVFVGPMKSSERVRMLINFLGRGREAQVGVEMLECAGSRPALKRKRRTRGKNKRIKVSGKA